MKMLLFFLITLFSTSLAAGDLYVITGSYKTQKEAQLISSDIGGWVLNTNLYSGLKPDLFAIVRGPFPNRQAAQKRLNDLTAYPEYRGSYIKDAGDIKLTLNSGNQATNPQMMAALLGGLRIEITEHRGGTNPCEPEEPYRMLSVKRIATTTGYDPQKNVRTFDPEDIEVEVGFYTQNIKTGEIEHLKVCAE